MAAKNVQRRSLATLVGLLYLFMAHAMINSSSRLKRLSESVWRASAAQHQNGIRQLLEPGLLSPAPLVAPIQKQQQQQQRDQASAKVGDDWSALDPRHPVYNFLIEYYGLKGLKGPRRLARWSPDPALLLQKQGGAPLDGILLEGASENDFASTLHMRGAIMHEDGIVYSPLTFFGKGEYSRQQEAARAASAYLWYKAVIDRTLQAEPVLHCHGLHEWAMQYQPNGAPPPPSAKYQAHLPLRVSRQTINEAVERKGVHCTHVDALRYFAEPASPLNHYGSHPPRRDEQLQMEQPACVHAQMDLIKMSLRLQPFLASDLLRDCLNVALAARRLDVAASPYDATTYGLSPIPVESSEGRAEYRRIQTQLMKQAKPVRRRLLDAYQILLELAFEEDALRTATELKFGTKKKQIQPSNSAVSQHA